MSLRWFDPPAGAPGTEPGFDGWFPNPMGNFLTRPATELGQGFVQTPGLPLLGGGDIHFSSRVDEFGNLIDPHTTLQGPGGFRTRL